MALFGVPKFVMVLPIEKLMQLGQADINKVRNELAEKGFFLQLPPPKEDMLKQHRRQLGLDDLPRRDN